MNYTSIKLFKKKKPNWSGSCFSDSLIHLPQQHGCASRAQESLTERNQALVVFQHDLFIQILLNGAQPLPLLLGEVDGQIPKRHWRLKWKRRRPFTVGLCFHTAGEDSGLPNREDTRYQGSNKETLEVLRSKGAVVINKTQCNMIQLVLKVLFHKKHINLDLHSTDKDKAFCQVPCTPSSC